MQNCALEHLTLGNLPAIKVKNALASATLLLQGAQVIQYQTQGQAALFWENPAAIYELGTAVRQGIPVCWPWFGQFEKNPPEVQQSFERSAHKEAHGFARHTLWSLDRHDHNNEGTMLLLVLNDTPANFPLRLSLEVNIGKQLQLKLRTENTSSLTMHFSQALHSYFAIKNITQTQVHGLENCHYFDAVDAWREKVQDGPLGFQSETDRVYFNTAETLNIVEAPGRTIRLSSRGSASTVVWNPWHEKSLKMSQMPKDAYQKFLCVETANAAMDSISLAAGQSHTLQLNISTH